MSTQFEAVNSAIPEDLKDKVVDLADGVPIPGPDIISRSEAKAKVQTGRVAKKARITQLRQEIKDLKRQLGQFHGYHQQEPEAVP